MSKESKPRDLWFQVFASAADRPANYCPSCGYYPVANDGEHRCDCMIAYPRPRGMPPW